MAEGLTGWDCTRKPGGAGDFPRPSLCARPTLSVNGDSGIGRRTSEQLSKIRGNYTHDPAQLYLGQARTGRRKPTCGYARAEQWVPLWGL